MLSIFALKQYFWNKLSKKKLKQQATNVKWRQKSCNKMMC